MSRVGPIAEGLGSDDELRVRYTCAAIRDGRPTEEDG